jgi:molybdopterin molybdotransferase
MEEPVADSILTVTEMRAQVLERCAPLAPVELALLDGAGRVLAEELHAQRDLPGVDNSAMDGIGVKVADVASASVAAPIALSVIGSALPGGATPAALQSGQGVRIMTGAEIPDGVEAVIMREACDESRADQGVIAVREPAVRGQHIRRRGEDVHTGDVVGRPGDVITPARLNLLLASGLVRASVVRAPRVAVLASGDELREVGEVADARAVINSNAHAIAAACRMLGCEVTMLGIANDTLASHEEKIEQARAHDVLLTIGGVSAGTHDFVRPALLSRGATLVAHKVAMRPGKPLAWAMLGTTRVLGLPGNPVSAMVSFALFVAPALRALKGLREVAPRTVEATLLEDISKKPGFEHYARAQLTRDGVRPLDKQGSHQISALADATVLAVLPRDSTGARAGERVTCIVLEG